MILMRRKSVGLLCIIFLCYFDCKMFCCWRVIWEFVVWWYMIWLLMGMRLVVVWFGFMIWVYKSKFLSCWGWWRNLFVSDLVFFLMYCNMEYCCMVELYLVLIVLWCFLVGLIIFVIVLCFWRCSGLLIWWLMY